jgi:hypothetical protein
MTRPGRKRYKAYSDCLAAKAADAALKIQITFDEPGLSYLPWETLYDGSDHLALSSKSCVVRNAGPKGQSLPLADLPIAVLGMVPRASASLNSTRSVLNVDAAT